ncbi:LPXTG cell wall anchor domain-containing protein [Streptomyces sp. HNM0645]|uniref:LPXTG cell wall anchor domain-containing protein n=1 Tax=Streptomyces sp. HNM0645 TaxID=2782343 RepID=UPI0024B74DF4|nr:LPXTG cell wall anchor domain-containing protein [Streptomyces sp. HNM0645]MDI9889281.1 LPXTG cell wall anchor domain-containing protein [Streptomyces sp. HNM0645]
MTLRRTVATAVAAAVTTPAVLFGTTPAFADDTPTASVTTPVAAEDAARNAGVLRGGVLAGKIDAGGDTAGAQAAEPSVEELEKAAAQAQKAYDDAVAAEKAALAAVEAAHSDDFPLAVVAEAAAKAAADAATAKTSADKALADAEAALAALPETAGPEEKDAAEKAVADAATAAGTAADAKTAADEKAKQTATDLGDARVASVRGLSKAQEAVKKALEAKKAADKALEDALEEQKPVPCRPESELTATLSGLPTRIAAGSTVEMKLRITNGTDRTLDEVWPFVYVHGIEKGGYEPVNDRMHLQWSTPTQTWTDAGDDYTAGSVASLKAGGHADIKLRLTVDAGTPDAAGAAFIAADYVNEDGTCGGSPKLTPYDFEVTAKPAPSASPSPGAATGTGTQTQTTTTQPLTTTSGSLASTGSSAALPQLAAAGAAVALGAGAVFAARRRKADSAS